MARPSERIGRYVVLDEIGRGGMGRVLRARDPELDRFVAIKVVLAADLGPTHTERLIREARAMATLSHPNVVQIYDVVEVGRRDVALVMEYVPGSALTRSLQKGTPPWSRVVDWFLAAGRGLAAAHAAGILHRDFKPDNVLLGDDGRVRVGDFGLAGELAPDEVLSASQLIETGALTMAAPTATRTATGRVVGTLPYMAPERLRGEIASVATDQFAFCVSVWQALFGTRPYAGHSAIELAIAMAGPPKKPSHDAGVPASIVATLRRGLSADPDARWPDMEALLVALAQAASAARRSRPLAFALGSIALAAVAWTWLDVAAAPCTPDAAMVHLRGVWDDDRRERVRRALLATDEPYAATVWAHTELGLNAYATAWTQMHAQTCAATTIDGVQSATMMDMRMNCLARARVDLEAVTRLFTDADARTVQHAHALVAGMRPLARCADVEALTADVEPPLPADADTVAQARNDLAAAEAARNAGRYDVARAHVDAARSALADCDYGPVQTELAYVDGLVLRDLDEFESARRRLVEASRLASAWRQTDMMHAAATSLVGVVGAGLHRPDDAQRWVEIAEETGDNHPLSRARLSVQRAAVADELGDYETAEGELREAVALRQSQLGDEHPHVIEARARLAAALHAQGKYDEAETHARFVLGAQRRVLGHAHPFVARSLHHLALILHGQQRLPEAEVELRHALAATEAAFGSEHRRVADVRNDLAAVLQDQGKLVAAEREHRRALARLEGSLGADDLDVASTRCDLAIVLATRGDFEAAVIELQRGIEVLSDTLGPHHPRVARQRHNLANVFEELERFPEAITEHRRVVDALQQSLRADHPDLALARTSLALLLVDRGRLQEARLVGEAAWERRRHDDTPPAQRAHTAFALAQAWSQGEDADPRRAVALAELALSDFETAGDPYAADAELVRSWLAR